MLTARAVIYSIVSWRKLCVCSMWVIVGWTQSNYNWRLFFKSCFMSITIFQRWSSTWQWNASPEDCKGIIYPVLRVLKMVQGCQLWPKNNLTSPLMQYHQLVLSQNTASVDWGYSVDETVVATVEEVFLRCQTGQWHSLRWKSNNIRFYPIMYLGLGDQNIFWLTN